MGAIQKFNIAQLREKYNAPVFVETGTLHGDAVQYALDSGFTSVYSVEIMAELAHKCQQRFSGNSNVTIYNTDSITFLQDITQDVEENIVFWLDAHFPGADSGLKKVTDEKEYDKRVPLEKELEVIRKTRQGKRDIIVLDDLWLYEDGPYPTSFNDHMKIYHGGVTREELCGTNSDFIYRLFPDTEYEHRKFYMDQGYLIILPK